MVVSWRSGIGLGALALAGSFLISGSGCKSADSVEEGTIERLIGMHERGEYSDEKLVWSSEGDFRSLRDNDINILHLGADECGPCHELQEFYRAIGKFVEDRAGIGNRVGIASFDGGEMEDGSVFENNLVEGADYVPQIVVTERDRNGNHRVIREIDDIREIVDVLLFLRPGLLKTYEHGESNLYVNREGLEARVGLVVNSFWDRDSQFAIEAIDRFNDRVEWEGMPGYPGGTFIFNADLRDPEQRGLYRQILKTPYFTLGQSARVSEQGFGAWLAEGHLYEMIERADENWVIEYLEDTWLDEAIEKGRERGFEGGEEGRINLGSLIELEANYLGADLKYEMDWDETLKIYTLQRFVRGVIRDSYLDSLQEVDSDYLRHLLQKADSIDEGPDFYRFPSDATFREKLERVRTGGEGFSRGEEYEALLEYRDELEDIQRLREMGKILGDFNSPRAAFEILESDILDARESERRTIYAVVSHNGGIGSYMTVVDSLVRMKKAIEDVDSDIRFRGYIARTDPRFSLHLPYETTSIIEHALGGSDMGMSPQIAVFDSAQRDRIAYPIGWGSLARNEAYIDNIARKD